jgi:hypothetical protein
MVGDFIKALFASNTEKFVHVCSLGNERDGVHAPRFVSTRNLQEIERFMHKWDRPGRGMFNCVSTINGVKRNKDACVECGFLHADIDFKNVVEDEPTIRERLRTLRYPPSIIVRSGNGLHCYWLFKEAIDVQEHRERIEAALRQLADLVAGDLQVCEVSRLMRLPGSHNTKQGAFLPVEIATLDGDRRYELDDIEEWLSETSPVILRKTRPAQTPEDNPFLAAAKLLGFKPSIDVEKRLAGMSFMGGGDAAVHQTQLAVSASLLNAGRWPGRGSRCDDPCRHPISGRRTVWRALELEAGRKGNRSRQMCVAWVAQAPAAASLSQKPPPLNRSGCDAAVCPAAGGGGRSGPCVRGRPAWHEARAGQGQSQEAGRGRRRQQLPLRPSSPMA